MRTLSLLVTVSLLSGCGLAVTRRPSRVVVTDSGALSSSEKKSTPKCHPSQYWDGEQCRHKGKGQGARKHDGESK